MISVTVDELLQTADACAGETGAEAAAVAFFPKLKKAVDIAKVDLYLGRVDLRDLVRGGSG